MASTEIRKVLSGGSEQALTRVEYTYDNPSVPANPTQVRSWDSSKGSYSNPLTTGNSLTATTQYNQYGMPTLITDARGLKTFTTYLSNSSGTHRNTRIRFQHRFDDARHGRR